MGSFMNVPTKATNPTLKERGDMQQFEKRYTISLDDDPVLNKIIAQMTGIYSVPFVSPKQLIERAPSYSPLAAFIDVHLGVGISGLEFIPVLRRIWPHVPLIVVTSDPEYELIGRALALGANDFIRKPVISEELVARMEARIAEMSARAEELEVRVYDVTYNKEHHFIRKDDRLVYLPNLEARLFDSLIRTGGMPMPKEALKARIWGKIAVSENALDKKISSLRRLLAEVGAGFGIKSAYGGGVNFEKSPQ